MYNLDYNLYQNTNLNSILPWSAVVPLVCMVDRLNVRVYNLWMVTEARRQAQCNLQGRPLSGWYGLYVAVP